MMLHLLHTQIVELWRSPLLPPAGMSDDDIQDERGPRLPRRLRQTLSLLAGGHSEKQIARRLGISPHTVHDYVKALHRRFGASSRSELLLRSRASEEFFFRRQTSEEPPTAGAVSEGHSAWGRLAARLPETGSSLPLPFADSRTGASEAA